MPDGKYGPGKSDGVVMDAGSTWSAELVRGLWTDRTGLLWGGLLLLVGWAVRNWPWLIWGRSERGIEVQQGGRSAAPRKGASIGRRVHSVPYHATLTGNTALLRLSFRNLGLRGIAAVGLLLAVEHSATDPLGRWLLNRVESQSEVRLTCDRVTGGLLSGGFVLHQVRAVQEHHPDANYDLRAARVTVRLTAWKLLRASLDIDQVRIEGVQGTYHRLRKLEGAPTRQTETKSVRRPSGDVQIGKLSLADWQIDFTDSAVEGDPIECQLAIDSFDCPRVRSSSAAYDLIFRSTVRGKINEHPFAIRTTATETGVNTEWRADRLPMQFARAYLEGPFRWLRSGECDVRVRQHRPFDPNAAVWLESHLVMRDVQPGVPSDTKPAVAIAAQLLISQLKQFPRDRDVGFTLKLPQNKFDLTRIEDRAELWKQYKAAAVAALLQTAAVNSEALPAETQERLDQAVDRLTNRALNAIEKVRAKREARKGARQKPGAGPQSVKPPAPTPAPE